MSNRKPWNTTGPRSSISNCFAAWANWACWASALLKTMVVQDWTPWPAPSSTRNCPPLTPGSHLLTWPTPCSLSTIWPTTVPRSKRLEFCPRSAPASGLVRWPCPNQTQAPMSSVSQPQPSSETTVLGCSTGERCGSPTGALTKTARQQTWCGSTPAPVRTSEGESRCRPSLLKPACLATAWVRKSTTKPGCGPQTPQNWSSMTASSPLRTSSAVLANPCST